MEYNVQYTSEVSGFHNFCCLHAAIQSWYTAKIAGGVQLHEAAKRFPMTRHGAMCTWSQAIGNRGPDDRQA